jgi:SOS-response transcriptional repressor LexA
MKRKSKRIVLPEWGLQITALRERLGINQAELARRMECSAMTISRWERGLLQPSAEHFIQLGNLADKTEAWFFWEMGGVRPAKVLEALQASPRRKRASGTAQRPGIDIEDKEANAGKAPQFVDVPLLKAAIGTHGQPGDRRSSLRAIPATSVVTTPASWCPNPAYTSLLRVKGHSMVPVLRHGDLVAVDSFQTERRDLYGQLVVVAHQDAGLGVSRLRRYDTLDVLEAESREYDPVILNKSTGWRIVGKVLWRISGTPF